MEPSETSSSRRVLKTRTNVNVFLHEEVRCGHEFAVHGCVVPRDKSSSTIQLLCMPACQRALCGQNVLYLAYILDLDYFFSVHGL